MRLVFTIFKRLTQAMIQVLHTGHKQHYHQFNMVHTHTVHKLPRFLFSFFLFKSLECTSQPNVMRIPVLQRNSTVHEYKSSRQLCIFLLGMWFLSTWVQTPGFVEGKGRWGQGKAMAVLEGGGVRSGQLDWWLV